MPRFARRLSASQRETFDILRALLSPASYADRSKLPREMKILKELRARYPDPAFWQQLKPAVPLDTLLEFKSQSGTRMIETQWENYQQAAKLREAEREAAFEHAVRKLEIELDTEIKPNTVDTNTLPKRKQSVLQWIDS